MIGCPLCKQPVPGMPQSTHTDEMTRFPSRARETEMRVTVSVSGCPRTLCQAWPVLSCKGEWDRKWKLRVCQLSLRGLQSHKGEQLNTERGDDRAVESRLAESTYRFPGAPTGLRSVWAGRSKPQNPSSRYSQHIFILKGVGYQFISLPNIISEIKVASPSQHQ